MKIKKLDTIIVSAAGKGNVDADYSFYGLVYQSSSTYELAFQLFIPSVSPWFQLQEQAMMDSCTHFAFHSKKVLCFVLIALLRFIMPVSHQRQQTSKWVITELRTCLAFTLLDDSQLNVSTVSI